MKKKAPTKGLRQRNVDKSQSYLPEVIRLFKKSMKQEGLKYRDLAALIGMSESGLKKVFIGRDCSLNRLSEIATALNLSIPEIFSELQSASPSSLEFNAKADHFLSENFDYFCFYWRLFYERMSVDEIRKADRLTEKAAFKYLRKLDQLGLIELHEDNRVKLPRAEFGYFKNSRLLQKMKNEWARTAFEDAVDNESVAKRFFTFYYLRLSDASLRKLTGELSALIQQYTRETVRNVNLRHRDTTDYRMIASIASGSFVKEIKRASLEECT